MYSVINFENKYIMIIREKYFSKIRLFYDQDLIKFITWIRRRGKSVILNNYNDN